MYAIKYPILKLYIITIKNKNKLKKNHDRRHPKQKKNIKKLLNLLK